MPSRERETRELDLRVDVRDFGPIGVGKIVPKPLTLFIGPNNSGKSYAAMLLHSILESNTPVGFPPRAPAFIRAESLVKRIDKRAFSKQFEQLKQQIEHLGTGEDLEIPTSLKKLITNVILEQIYERRLSREIVRAFACPLDELISIGKKSFELRVAFDSHKVHSRYQRDADRLRISKYPQPDIKVRIRVTDTPGPLLTTSEEEQEFLITVGAGWQEIEDYKQLMFSQLMDVLLMACASRIVENVERASYYLPAARSGILQGHKALAASIVSKAPQVGIERLEIPKFSGVVADFISSLITLPDERGMFYQLAEEFEEKLIQGEIRVRILDEYLYPEIEYLFRNTEIALHRASSTVSELAPLFLYLKYYIEPGSVLIIEEPEAHLHPRNQRILAKLLVRLVREGVYITITTHSEYLLEQLSSFILLSKVDPQKRVKKYRYGEKDFLGAHEIAAYVFRPYKTRPGHRITQVEITEEDGISQDEFVNIHEALYEETIKLLRDLDAET